MMKKRKPIDAFLIEDKNNPQYYICKKFPELCDLVSNDISICGKLFDATVFGTYLYSNNSMAKSIAKKCGGRVVPIKIIFKTDNIAKRIINRLNTCIYRILMFIGNSLDPGYY